MNRLAGKVAIVTGAGRGIGREYVLALAGEGANVVVNDLGGTVHGRGDSSGPADDVVKEAEALGVKAIESYEDVASHEGAARTVQRAIEAFGTVDILITNAGIERRGPLYELSEEDWDAVQGTHAKGTYNYVRHAAPVMVKKGSGTIINITSGAAWGGNPRIGAYAAGKGAIISFMLSLSTELQPHNVNVNCLSPGLTATRLVDDYVSDLQESRGMAREDAQTMVSSAQPAAAMTPMAVFLSTPEGHGITGKIFEISGDRITVINPPKRGDNYIKAGGWSVDDVFAAFPRSL